MIDYARLDNQLLREVILLGMIPHANHDGLPSATPGTYCARCRAEDAMAELVSRATRK